MSNARRPKGLLQGEMHKERSSLDANRNREGSMRNCRRKAAADLEACAEAASPYGQGCLPPCIPCIATRPHQRCLAPRGGSPEAM